MQMGRGRTGVAGRGGARWGGARDGGRGQMSQGATVLVPEKDAGLD